MSNYHEVEVKTEDKQWNASKKIYEEARSLRIRLYGADDAPLWDITILPSEIKKLLEGQN